MAFLFTLVTNNGTVSVVLFCFDRPEDRRRFMQFSNSNGYVTDEFVYVMPVFPSDRNISEPWRDFSDQPDGLDDEVRVIYEKLLVVS